MNEPDYTELFEEIRHVICPQCEGEGKHEGRGFVCGKGGCKIITEWKCGFCKGKGEVPEEQITWLEKGRAFQKYRIEHSISQREAALWHSISVSVLNDMEHGRIENGKLSIELLEIK